MSSEKAKEKSSHYSVNNIFDYEEQAEMSGEIFDILWQNKALKIERIISAGHVTPADEPYIQDTHEWVILLKGRAEIKTPDKTHLLKEGSYLFIPAQTKHWITFTSKNPECVWLAMHFPVEQ